MKKCLEISSPYTSTTKIMMICSTVAKIWRVTDVIFIFILGYFLPFYPPSNPKIKIYKKIKRISGDIIILHICTKNFDHMTYGSFLRNGARKPDGQKK